MDHTQKVLIAAGLMVGTIFTSAGSAHAQYYGPAYGPAPMMAPYMAPPVLPYYGQPSMGPRWQGHNIQRPVFNPGPGQRGYGIQRPIYSPGRQQMPPRFQRPTYSPDLIGPYGPAIGSAVAGGLTSVGVPAPVAGWAGDRVSANARAAYRENGPVNQGVRTFTGVSVRDIEQNGLRGGPNSEVNKVLNFFGF